MIQRDKHAAQTKRQCHENPNHDITLAHIAPQPPNTNSCSDRKDQESENGIDSQEQRACSSRESNVRHGMTSKGQSTEKQEVANQGCNNGGQRSSKQGILNVGILQCVKHKQVSFRPK